MVYPLLDVLWWNLIGQWMDFIFHYVHSAYFRRYLLPTFDAAAPQWWKDSWGHSYNWYSHLTNGVPDGAFAWYYKRAARDRFSDWINKAADNVARALTDAIYNLLGNLMYGYARFTDWINAIWTRVGPNVPSWASNVMEALWNLWNWFPGDIRDNVVSWYDKFAAWYNAAISWAQSRYEATKVWVANTGNWLVAGYNTVRGWYDSAHAWLDDFRYNAYARVTGWLGSAWDAWRGVRYGIVNFYNTCWVPYKITLHDFLADPLGWLYDRVEAELIRRW